jgi:anti-sigma B factor antagonist
METTLDLSDRNNYLLITIKGKFTAQVLPQVQKALEIARAKDYVNIAFDFHLVGLIESAGLGFLANCYRELAGRGGRVYCIDIPPPIKKVFEATKLDKIFRFFSTIEEADKNITRSMEKQDRGFYFLFKINGNFDIAILKDLRSAIDKAVGSGQKNFLFDLSSVTLITSSGIGLLANLQKNLLAKNGKLILAGATGVAYESLETAHLFDVIKHFPSLDAAELEFDIKF